MKKSFVFIFLMIFTTVIYSQGMYTLSYTVSFGTGETHDYISKASFRGLSFDGRVFLNEKVTIGGLINWTTFYENPDNKTFTKGTLTFTGNQKRYINAFPILFTAHYYFNDYGAMPRFYFGVGVGTYKIVQRTDMGVYRGEQKNWHLGVSPDLGLLFPFSKGQHLNVNLRWNYALEADETINYSWVGLSIGYSLRK